MILPNTLIISHFVEISWVQHYRLMGKIEQKSQCWAQKRK
jgi:hypothetical protein